MARPWHSRAALTGFLCLLTACGAERPPQPGDNGEPASAPATEPEGDPSEPNRVSKVELEAGALLTYAGAKGAFFDVEKLDDVPGNARGFVKVALEKGPKAPPNQVWVVNFEDGQPEPWPLKAVARDMYEEYALGRGNSSEVDMDKVAQVGALPEGLTPPEAAPPGEKIVMYSTTWCGVCKKLKKYLDRKGVEYEIKDVEKDPGAAAELKTFAKSRGGWTGSVPVLVMGDEMMVGFNRAKLEKML